MSIRSGLRSLLVAIVAVVAAAAAPDSTAAQTPADTLGPEKVTYNAERGTVTFSHRQHGADFACASCHHESKPEKPLASPRQKCGDCHTPEPVAPMKTSRKLAFHSSGSEDRSGICVDCHVKEAAKVPVNKDAPARNIPIECDACHKEP